MITPGDHYSPNTGSAVPTVVHGLCQGLPAGEPRPVVVLERGTMQERHPSADPIEYQPAKRLPRPIARLSRYLDAPVGPARGRRPMAARGWAAALSAQGSWAPSIIIGHNAPQLPRLVDADRHRPVLYAHNHVLRTYGPREAGRALDRVHRVVAVSDALASQLADRLPPRLRGRVVVVRNGVDCGFFARPSGSFGREGPMRIAFVGRMIPDKGADVLVSAVSRMRAAKEVTLTLVGSSGFSANDPLTPFERSVRQSIESARSRALIRPFAPRPEIAAFLATVDVLVVPSRWAEPFALTVLEGMAAGCAVVASDIGGIPEAAGGAALLVPPRDPDALAVVLDSLAEDEPRRLRLVRASLERARARDWHVVGRELVLALEGS